MQMQQTFLSCCSNFASPHVRRHQFCGYCGARLNTIEVEDSTPAAKMKVLFISAPKLDVNRRHFDNRYRIKRQKEDATDIRVYFDVEPNTLTPKWIDSKEEKSNKDFIVSIIIRFLK